MIKVKYILFIGLYIFISATSYGQTPRELIAKKWVFKEVDKQTLDTMITKQRSKEALAIITDSTQKVEGESEAEKVNKLFADLVFEIKPDGTCETGGRKDKKIEKGNWTLSNDGKKIIIINDQNKKQELDITKLTPDELTIGMPTGSGSIQMCFSSGKTPKEMLIKKWIFKEINKQSLDSMIAKQVEKFNEILASITDSTLKTEAEIQMKETMAKVPEEMQKTFKDLTLEFKADETCEMGEMMGSKPEKGKWEITPDGKKLTIIDDKKKNYAKVVKLTSNELFIILSEGDIEIGIVFTASK